MATRRVLPVVILLFATTLASSPPQAAGAAVAACIDAVFANGFEEAGPGARAEGTASCVNPLPADAGCGGMEQCGPDDLGNGLDDDCNGMVDETCSCVPGTLAACFTGPPGKRNVGVCSDGVHSCVGAEFGSWTECAGSVTPSAEVCDGADNDCNNCVDD